MTDEIRREPTCAEMLEMDGKASFVASDRPDDAPRTNRELTWARWIEERRILREEIVGLQHRLRVADEDNKSLRNEIRRLSGENERWRANQTITLRMDRAGLVRAVIEGVQEAERERARAIIDEDEY